MFHNDTHFRARVWEGLNTAQSGWILQNDTNYVIVCGVTQSLIIRNIINLIIWTPRKDSFTQRNALYATNDKCSHTAHAVLKSWWSSTRRPSPLQLPHIGAVLQHTRRTALHVTKTWIPWQLIYLVLPVQCSTSAWAEWLWPAQLFQRFKFSYRGSSPHHHAHTMTCPRPNTS